MPKAEKETKKIVASNKKESLGGKANARLRYLKIAPRKTRKIADSIRGLRATEAEAELLYRPQRAAEPILKLLRSAVSNAQNKNLNRNNLYVSEIKVDQGPMLKRSMPRAKGRATMIQKKMSHISITLSEKENLKSRKYKAPIIKKIKSDKKKISSK